jgi:hypothetical protein
MFHRYVRSVAAVLCLGSFELSTLTTVGHEDEREVAERRQKYGEQDAWGNSVDSLRANLRLTPIERLRRLERAANSLLELKRALKRID